MADTNGTEQASTPEGGAQATHVPGGMAHLVVEVKDDASVRHQDETYGPGEGFVVEGLTAVAHAQAGHVNIVGTHDGDMPKTKRGHIRAHQKATGGGE